MSFIKRVIRYLRPESGELQDALEENVHFDRDKIDESLEELLHSARQMRRSSHAFIVAAELLVKDVRGEQRSKGSGQKNTPRTTKAK